MECQDVEMVMEESPVGEHQSNGQIEGAIRQIQGVFRSMKDALEARIGKRLKGDSWAIPWLIKHATAMMNRLHVQSNGKCVKACGSKTQCLHLALNWLRELQ